MDTIIIIVCIFLLKRFIIIIKLYMVYVCVCCILNYFSVIIFPYDMDLFVSYHFSIKL